jgi:uncharacterized protein YggE
VRDFSVIGALMDDSIQEGIVEFRSLTYSLADEEGAKERAAADAMHNATGRADAALQQKGQRLGALRYANLDVKQLIGIARMETFALEAVEVNSGNSWGAQRKIVPQPPPPPARPEKITVTATVQCIFQIQ